jgi:hypothetical protein
MRHVRHSRSIFPTIALPVILSCCGGHGSSSATETAPPGSDAGGSRSCPVTITIPQDGEAVGPSINISVTQSTANGCEPTTAMTAFIDQQECDLPPYPYPNAGCKVAGTGSPNTLNFSQSTWVQVTPVVHTLTVKSWDAAGDASTSSEVHFTYTPADGGTPEGGTGDGGTLDGGATDPVLIGAGDIANYSPTTWETNTGIALGNLVGNNPGALVFTLGDNAYGPGGTAPDDCDQGGSPSDFEKAFTPTLWGSTAILGKMLPMPGNHEYDNCDLGTCVNSGCSKPALPTGADWVMSGYWSYFNGRTAVSPGGGTAVTLHYGTTLVTSGGKKWRYESVDSGMCFYAPENCASGSSEYQWLQTELETYKKPDFAGIIVATHIDPWDSAGCPGGSGNVFPLWDLAYQYHVDVFLDGHIHGYERFTQLGPSSSCKTADPTNGTGGCPAKSSFCMPVADANGPTLITLGSGGASLSGITAHPLPTSLKQINNYGIGLFRLHDASWDFAFYQVDSKGNGTVQDSVTAQPVH